MHTSRTPFALALVVLLFVGAGRAATPEDYVRVLERWNATAKQWSHEVPDSDGLVFFGTGGHENWAVQAHATAFAAVAVLATAPELDEGRAGESRDALRTRALGMLRYLLRTHKSGDRACTTGQAWGFSWISALALERMTHGYTVLKPWLTADDRRRMRGVLIAESDYVLKDYEVVGAIDGNSGKNRPESNIWNGALLYRTALLYPDAPQAAKYREKASSLLLNGISVPSDAASEKVYSGKPLKQWHVGPNYTETLGLNHHGYLNVGYMEICLSNIAMLHFFCQENSLPPPQELYHHADELWRLTKSLTFDDGRLWRIGGDTRVRYCYCQDYAVPVWLMIADRLGDPDAAKFEDGWLKLVAAEQASNPDGAFLSGRLAKLRDASPFYYCRLEGDRAVSMSMGASYRRIVKQKPPSEARRVEPLKSWSDDFHGAAMVRGNRRLASWVWKSAQRPCGTVVPADRSDMVEWQWNLAGLIRGTGFDAKAAPEKKPILYTFDGGFATWGRYRWTTSANAGEGSTSEEVAIAQTAMVALPDDATVVVLQRAIAARPVYINQVLGLNLNMPNDLFNRGTRTYRFDGMERQICGAGAVEPPARELIACGKTLQIDGRLHVGVIYGESGLSLFRPGARNAVMVHNVPAIVSGAGASLYCDVITTPARLSQQFCQANELLYDIGAAIGVDFAPIATARGDPRDGLKMVEITAANHRRYLVAANFGDHPQQSSVEVSGRFETLCGKGASAIGKRVHFDLAPGEVVVLALNDP